MAYKTGRVILLGEANVGKSSIVNKIVGEDVAITADTPGTTREEIRGIKTTDTYQIIFQDVPGMQEKRNELDRMMQKSIGTALANTDVILYVLDATDFRDEHVAKVRNYAKKDKPIILLVNKADRTTMNRLYPKIAPLNELEFVRAIIPTSAKTGMNMDVIESEIVKHLPVGEAMFADDDFTDQSTRRMAEEIIRGAVMTHTRAELPHSVAVKITKWREEKREVEIHAEIYCVKASHKPIIIGKRGQMLKLIGTDAREKIRQLTGKHTRLFTHVLVREDWKNKKSLIEDFVKTNN
ncbi:MAG: GTPase Era [Firmicutes bacterium]|nr:GTPase Era [Bacillota bacterium]